MNNQSLNIPNEQLLLIDILNTIYNDNLRQINSLTTSNNEIRNVITNLLSNNTNSRTQQQNRFRNRNNNYRESFSRSSSQDRVYINNLPYVVEDVREYRIPSSQLYNWIQNSNVSTSESQPRTNRSQPRMANFSRAFQSFFEPVEIFPTQTQIEIATRRAMYCDIVSPINRACPISLENFNDSDTVSVIRYCGHIFHTEHLNRWFRTNCRCPVCRYDIRNYTSSSSNFTPANEINDSPPALSTQSRPLNETENNVNPYSNDEQGLPETQTPSMTLNSYVYRYLNDISDTSFIDSSGNFTTDVSDASSLLRLLTGMQNRLI
jgi:hypothetical protein